MLVNKRLPSRVVVLGTQFVFNIGFYAVIPFLAIHMRDDLLMGSTMIGIVLGIRTFSQQGMFFLGGLLAERFGYRTLMLLGCAVRIMGYIGLAISETPWPLIVSACLTGLGGAMFSPCIEALTAEIDQEEKNMSESIKKLKNKKYSIFTYFSIIGQIGAVGGPIIGGLLFHWGFGLVAMVCAGIFAGAAIILYGNIPEIKNKSQGIKKYWKQTIRNHGFLYFSIGYSTYLFSYNQIYMALPKELERIHAPDTVLGWFFALASVLVIFLQIPVSKICQRWNIHIVLMLGFLLMALAFLGLAIGVHDISHEDAETWSWHLLPAIGFVIFLSLGQMCAVPVAMSLVPRLAMLDADTDGTSNISLPMYYGLLASVGGIMVLVGNIFLGILQDWANSIQSQSGNVWPLSVSWCMAALLPTLSAWWMFQSKDLLKTNENCS